MIQLHRIPQDCSAETLFPKHEQLLMGLPLGYALQNMGHGLSIKIPYWAVCLDPLEENKVVGGITEHDNYICLCKWIEDGSPMTYRFRKNQLYEYTEAELEGFAFGTYLNRLYNIRPYEWRKK